MRVVWCRSADEGHQIGGQFRTLSEEQLEYLEVFVTFLEALPWPAPGQEPEIDIEQSEV
jgi:hypothetical protein